MWSLPDFTGSLYDEWNDMKNPFESLFSQKKEAEPTVKGLHRNFRLREGGWYFNREHSIFRDQGIAIKCRFGFDDPMLLDGCPFYAKIGVNTDPSVSSRYIGFVYGKKEDQQAMEDWGRQFPFAEIITDLDREGVSTDTSQRKEIEK
jgi:hypothetical protein